MLDIAAFTDLEASVPYPAGIWLAEETDAVEALGIVLRSVGACLFPTRGSRLAPLRLRGWRFDRSISLGHIFTATSIAVPS